MSSIPIAMQVSTGVVAFIGVVLAALLAYGRISGSRTILWTMAAVLIAIGGMSFLKGLRSQST